MSLNDFVEVRMRLGDWIKMCRGEVVVMPPGVEIQAEEAIHDEPDPPDPEPMPEPKKFELTRKQEVAREARRTELLRRLDGE